LSTVASARSKRYGADAAAFSGRTRANAASHHHYRYLDLRERRSEASRPGESEFGRRCGKENDEVDDNHYQSVSRKVGKKMTDHIFNREGPAKLEASDFDVELHGMTLSNPPLASRPFLRGGFEVLFSIAFEGGFFL
jgi:hypothetical protein